MKKIFTILIIFFSLIFLKAQTYSEDFELLTKSSYATANVTLNSSYIWDFSGAVAGNSTTDWKLGAKSARLGGTVNTATANYYSKIEMTTNKTGGIGNISFYYTAYGTDSQIPWKVQWSADGTTWTDAGAAFTGDATIQVFSFDLNQPTARIRIISTVSTTSTANGKRLNIDNLTLTDNNVPLQPVIDPSSSPLNFNSVIINETSTKKLTFYSKGLSAATTQAITGTNSSLFTLTGSITGTTGTLDITFSPTTVGNKTAVLTVSGGTASATVTLNGTGLDNVNPYGLVTTAPLASVSENFDSYALNATTIGGWTNFVQDDNRTWAIKAATNPATTNNAPQMTAFGGNGYYKTLLISPALDLTNIKSAKFDWAGTFANGALLNVYFFQLNSGSPMTKTLLTTIDTGATNGTITFANKGIDLSTFSGVGFVAFEYVGNTLDPKTTTMYVDNFITSSTVLAVSDVKNIKVKFIKNTLVDNTIEFSSKADVKLYNANGQLVRSAKVNEGTALNVSSLPKGVYIVVGEVDGQNVSQKIIKQ